MLRIILYIVWKAFKQKISGKKGAHSFDESFLGRTHSAGTTTRLNTEESVSIPTPSWTAPPSTCSGGAGSPKEQLEKYCKDQGKPKPHFDVERVNGRYRATVYVAKTCGWLTGDFKRTKWEAEMNAAKQLLQKLEL